MRGGAGPSGRRRGVGGQGKAGAMRALDCSIWQSILGLRCSRMRQDWVVLAVADLAQRYLGGRVVPVLVKVVPKRTSCTPL